jgi:uncharacterized membrane protein YkvA (DUF1232 family)
VTRFRSRAGGSPRSSPRSERRGALGSRHHTLLETILQIPAYLRLLGGLFVDPRVSAIDKLLVGAAIAYIVSPLDLIPDFIPFVGQVDDIYLLFLALQRLIRNAGFAVIADHWRGEIEDLSPGRLRAVLLAASLLLPTRVRRRLRRRVA